MFGRNPHNVYCTPDGRYMLATSMGFQKLTAIDVRTEEPAFEIPLPGVPRPLAIDAPAGRPPERLFVQLRDSSAGALAWLMGLHIIQKCVDGLEDERRARIAPPGGAGERGEGCVPPGGQDARIPKPEARWPLKIPGPRCLHRASAEGAVCEKAAVGD